MVIFQYTLYNFGIHLWPVLYPKPCYNEQCYKEVVVYHQGLCSPFIHSVISNYSVRGQWRPWSACKDAEADLGLGCPNMPKDIFLHGAAHKISGMILNSEPLWSIWLLMNKNAASLGIRQQCRPRSASTSSVSPRSFQSVYNVLGLDYEEEVNNFLISSQKHILWYSLEAPLWGNSNEYHMFLQRNKKTKIIWVKKEHYLKIWSEWLVTIYYRV